MPPTDTYRGFASHYDLYGWDWFAMSHGARLAELLEERGFSGCRLLDAGCGSGTLALDLAARGHQVTGIDLSEGMIEIARRKDAEGRVRWARADIAALEDADLGGPFDAIVCVADILCHLPSLELWSAAFRGFRSQLRPSGALFFDLPTCLGLERMDRMSFTDADGRALSLYVVYEPEERRSTMKVTSFVLQPSSGLYERASATITEWGQPVAAILDRLKAAGFPEAERVWTSQPDPESEYRLDVLARRD
jgi:SAM-dependent methyltransferase